MTSLPNRCANAFGLIGGKANAIEPNKRPLSSMSPTVLKDGKPWLVTGSPGGAYYHHGIAANYQCRRFRYESCSRYNTPASITNGYRMSTS